MDENIDDTGITNPPSILDFWDGHTIFLYLLNNGSVFLEPRELDSYSVKINDLLDIDGIESELKRLAKQIKVELWSEIKKASTVDKKRMVAINKFSELQEASRNIQMVEGFNHHKQFNLKNNSGITSFNESHPDLQGLINSKFCLDGSHLLIRFIEKPVASVFYCQGVDAWLKYREQIGIAFFTCFVLFNDLYSSGV